MAVTTLKGIVKDVLPIEQYGIDKKGRKQTIVLFIPGKTDDFSGIKTGNDEHWGVHIFNDKIDELGLNRNTIDKKVEVEVRLRGGTFDRKDKKGLGFAITASLRSIKILDSAYIFKPAGDERSA